MCSTMRARDGQGGKSAVNARTSFQPPKAECSETPIYRPTASCLLLLALCLAVSLTRVASAASVEVTRLDTPVSIGDVVNFEITPDSSTVVFTGDFETDGVFELFSAPIDGSAPSVKLNDPLPYNRDVARFSVSPNGARVVYLLSSYAIYSVAPNRSAPPVQLNGPLQTGRSVFDYAISPDGQTVVYRADQDTKGVTELYAVPVDGGAAPVKLNAPLSAGGIDTFLTLPITPDSLFVVYKARQENTVPADLYSVPILGTAPPVKLNGPIVPGGSIRHFRISPTGDHVVYKGDLETEGVCELFCAPVDGSASAVKLNGPRVVEDVVYSGRWTTGLYEITPNGQHVAYWSGDDTDSPLNLFSVATDGITAAVKLNPPNTVGAETFQHREYPLAITPDARRVVFLAREEAGETQNIYSVPVDGSLPAVALSESLHARHFWIPREGISGNSESVIFATTKPFGYPNYGGLVKMWQSPIDGRDEPAQIAEVTSPSGASTSPGHDWLVTTTVVVQYGISNSNMMSFNLTASGAAVPNVLDVQHGVTGFNYRMSPDGKWVVYAADQLEPDVQELFSTPIDRSEPRRLNTNRPSYNDGEVLTYAVAPDEQHVAYAATRGGDTSRRLYVSPADGHEPPAALLPFPVGQKIYFSPSNSELVTDSYISETYESRYGNMVRVLTDASVPPQVFDSSVRNYDCFAVGELSSIVFSPCGDIVGYTKNQETGVNCFEDMESECICHNSTSERTIRGFNFGTGSVNVQDFTFADRPVSTECITCDGVLLYVMAQKLYADLIDGSPSPVLLSGDIQLGSYSDSGPYLVIADESSAYFVGSPDGHWAIYSAPLDGSTPPLQLTPAGYRASLAAELVSRPDGPYVISLGNPEAGSARHVCLVPKDGSGEVVTLSGPMVAGRDVRDFVVASDDAWVAYTADQDSDNVFELYGVPLDGSAAPVKLNGVMAPGGNVRSYRLSRNGRQVVYLADQDTDEVVELYAAPVDGTAPAVKLNGPLAPDSGVYHFAISTDGSMASYLAEHLGASTYMIYSVPISGGEPILRSLPGTCPDGAGIWAGDRLIYRDYCGGADGKSLYSSIHWGPKVTIGRAPTQPKQVNALPVRHIVAFDQTPYGLDATDFVNDGTAPGVQFALTWLTSMQHAGMQYESTQYALDCVAVEGDGTIIPHLPPGTVTSAYGRPNPDSTGVDHVVLLDRTPPVITIMETNPFRLACTGVYVPRGATAVDAVDGAVPVSRVSDPVNPNVPGEYDVVYEAIDQLGNAGYATLRVEVVDTTPPTLTLVGDPLMRMRCGEVFTDPGATAEDVCAGALTVAVSGNVDTTNAGFYTLTYTADDGNGHVVTAQRHVDVRCNCILSNVQVHYPPGGATIRLATQNAATLTLQAATDCPEDTAALEFFLDGEPLTPSARTAPALSPHASLAPSPWTGRAGVGFSMGYYSTRVSGITGSPTGTPHTLAVLAVDRFGGTLTATSTFTVFTATELQPNGLPLTPLADLLPQDGDSFYAEAELSPGCIRSIGMLAWDADTQSTAPASLELAHPDAPDAPVRVTAPRALLEPGERGILLLLLGCDSPDTTLDEGIDNIDTSPGELSTGARYLFATALTSADGIDFDDIDPLRLATNPLHLDCWGIKTTSNREPALYTHPGETLFDPMAVSGALGAWTETETTEKAPDTAYLAAEVSATGLMAVFDVDPKGPCLRVTPNPQFPVQLGLVRLGETLEIPITLENTGTGFLEGAITLEAGPEFSLTGPTSYRLGPGERTLDSTYLVRYTPASTDTRTATVTFSSTGDGDPSRTNATLTLIGNGTTNPKPFNILGCGPAPVSPAPPGATLALLTAATLILRSRRSRHTQSRP